MIATITILIRAFGPVFKLLLPNITAPSESGRLCILRARQLLIRYQSNDRPALPRVPLCAAADLEFSLFIKAEQHLRVWIALPVVIERERITEHGFLRAIALRNQCGELCPTRLF